MVKSLLTKLTHNLGLKILAVVFAIALWFVVVNTDDPKVTKRFTSSVTLENASYLADQGKYYELLDGSNTITFTVTAKRSYMDQLSSTDFKVIANLENTEISADSNIAAVPIEITPQRYSSQVSVTNYTRKIQIVVEDLQAEQFIVSPQVTGEMASGTVTGDLSATPNLVSVSGPESVVSQIDHIYAVADMTGMTGDITVSCLPIAYDVEGNIVDSSRISFNVSTITVSVSILDTKSVGIICNYSGEPAEGYRLREITYDPETVTIKGKSQALNSVTNITIPESALILSGAAKDITQVVDVSAYLPSGVSVVGDAKITVTAVIEEQVSKTFNLYTSNIDVLNVPEGMDVRFEDSVVPITLRGQQSDIDKITSSTLTGTIDAADFLEGEMDATVHLELPSGVSYDEVTVRLVMANADEAIDPQAETDATEADENDDTENAENSEEVNGEEIDTESETEDGNTESAEETSAEEET